MKAFDLESAANESEGLQIRNTKFWYLVKIITILIYVTQTLLPLSKNFKYESKLSSIIRVGHTMEETSGRSHR